MRKQRKATMLIAGLLASVCTVAGVSQISTANAESVSPTSLVTAGSNVTVSTSQTIAGQGLLYGVQIYAKQWTTGMKVAVPASADTTIGEVTTCAMDLNELENDVLLRGFPCSININAIEMEVIEVGNEDNYVSIKYTPNTTYTWTYQNKIPASIGSDYVVSYATSEGYTQITGYEAGLMMDDWAGFDVAGWDLIDADFGDGQGFRNIAYTEFNRYTIGWDGENLTTASKTLELANWVGFESSDVYVKLSWETANTDTWDLGTDGGLFIDMIAGMDTTGTTIPEKTYNTTGLVTAGSNVTVTAAQTIPGQGLLYGVQRYAMQFTTGMRVAVPTTVAGGEVTTKTMDLNALKNNVLLRSFPCSTNVNAIKMEVIEVGNEDNYVSIRYTPNTTYTYTHPSRVPASLGSDYVVSYATSEGYTEISGYEAGLMMNDWVGYDVAGWELINADFGDGQGVRNIAYTEFNRFTLGWDGENLTTASKTLDLANWVGFETGKVYVKLSWESANIETWDIGTIGGLFIDMIAGVDTTGTTVTENVVVYNKALANVSVNKEVAVDAVRAWSYVKGEASVKGANVYFNDGSAWVDKTSLVADGKFTPDVAGEWKVVYTVGGRFEKKELTFTVTDPMAEFLKLLNVKAQVNTSDADNLQIRFLATIDSLDYARVGFEIIANDTMYQASCKNVYTSVLASGVERDVQEVSDSDLANYIFMFTVSGVPTEDTQFTVRAYVETFDGEVIYGAARTLAIADAN